MRKGAKTFCEKQTLARPGWARNSKIRSDYERIFCAAENVTKCAEQGILIAAIREGKYMAQQPKSASRFTKEIHQKYQNWLDFANKQDFEDAAKGFIAPLPNSGETPGATPNGTPSWNIPPFAQMADGKTAPDTVNPSLWRQTQLDLNAGLYKVCDGVYQFRNGNIANVTFVDGPTGVTIIDCGSSVEDARVGKDLFTKHVSDKPIVAVIYTHTHIDHYGGVAGLVSADDVKSGKVVIAAPGTIDEFNKYALGENVVAGNAMARRASYAFGEFLPISPTGVAGDGIALWSGGDQTISYMEPTDSIMTTGETRNFGGVDFVFQMAPDTEAPLEMHIWLPQFKALTCAENVNHSLHNIQTLRGARTRDAANFAKFIDEALVMFGHDVEVHFGMHTWPMFGRDRVVDMMESQRDMYKFLHDQTLRLANHGYAPTEIAEMLAAPDSLATRWWNRNYHGSLNHDVKAVFNKELGFWDGNPASLYPLPPTESAKRWVKLVGVENIIADAKAAHENGDCRWAVELLAKVIWADPTNQVARDLQADAYEQLGYQVEAPQWRNIFLSAAKELRDPTPSRVQATASRDTVMGMPMDLTFDYTAVRLNAEKSNGAELSINFVLPDLNTTWNVWLKNDVLHYRPTRGNLASLTVTAPSALVKELLFVPQMADKILADDHVSTDGDVAVLRKLLGLLDTFDLNFQLIAPNPGQKYLDFLR